MLRKLSALLLRKYIAVGIPQIYLYSLLYSQCLRYFLSSGTSSISHLTYFLLMRWQSPTSLSPFLDSSSTISRTNSSEETSRVLTISLKSPKLGRPTRKTYSLSTHIQYAISSIFLRRNKAHGFPS